MCKWLWISNEYMNIGIKLNVSSMAWNCKKKIGNVRMYFELSIGIVLMIIDSLAGLNSRICFWLEISRV